MKAILPIFACLLATTAVGLRAAHGQLPTAPTARGPTAERPASPAEDISGDVLLRRVLAAVNAQTSIAARLRYQVQLLGRRTIGSGVYLQQGRGPARQFRLELSLDGVALASRLRHVSDATTVWIAEEYPGDMRLARVDVARLRHAQPKTLGQAPDARDWLLLGGLPKMLDGLDGAFEFKNASESQLDDVRVWTLVGEWEKARLVGLLPNQKENIESGGPVDFGKLSPQLPTSVVLHVGRDDLFPYRLEYWRSEKGDGDRASGSRGKLLVVMELYEVKVGAPIDPAQFVFEPPPGRKPLDRTQEFLERLGLEDTAPAGARRASSPRR
jgi:hypothetical protein